MQIQVYQQQYYQIVQWINQTIFKNRINNSDKRSKIQKKSTQSIKYKLIFYPNNYKVIQVPKNQWMLFFHTDKDKRNYKTHQQILKNKLSNSLLMQNLNIILQNLVLRQLNQGQNIQMKNMENLNLQAIQVLNRKIKQMEDKVTFYQRSHKQYDKVSGFVTKNRDIVTPQDLAIELKNKQQQWKDQLEVMKNQVQQYKKNQENLMVVNTVLRNRIVSLQAQLAMPNRNLGEVLDKSLKKLMLYFIQVQKKIVTGQDDSESDSQNDIQLIAPQLSGLFPEKVLRIQKNYGVPYIDLLKIRQQMNHSNTKIKQALLARNHLTDRQKIQRYIHHQHRLQIELEYTRRQLSRNIIDLREEVSKRKKSERLVSQLAQRMNLLISSNQQLEIKVRRYWEKLKSEKEKIYGLSDNQETGKGLIEEEVGDGVVVPEQIATNSKKKQKRKIQVFNPSALMNEYQIDYKIHLQIMAKQLQKNKKLKKLKNYKAIKHDQQPTLKIKRSSSNPLLYFNERRNIIMDVKNQGKLYETQQLRLQQTYYAPEQNLPFEQLVYDIDS